MDVDSKKMLHQDSKLCGICFKDLSMKVTVSVDTCRHAFHRSCMLDWCEEGAHKPCKAKEGGAALPAPCPQCAVTFNKIVDERGAEVPMIMHLGPTGEPSAKFFAMLLGQTNAAETIDSMHVLTACRLLWASNELFLARKAVKDTVYINDLASEKQKMLDRHAKLNEMQQRCSAFQELFSSNNNGKAASVSDDQPFTAMDALGQQEICTICFDILSAKRTTRLGICGHKFHRTCIIKWEEHEKNVSWREDLRSNDFACCASRAEQERRRIVTVLGQLTQDKRCAIRDQKADEYVGDIEEEMVKMRKRMQDVENFLLAEALQATEQVEEEDSEEDENDGLGDDNGGVGHDNGWETEEEEEE